MQKGCAAASRASGGLLEAHLRYSEQFDTVCLIVGDIRINQVYANIVEFIERSLISLPAAKQCCEGVISVRLWCWSIHRGHLA